MKWVKRTAHRYLPLDFYGRAIAMTGEASVILNKVKDIASFSATDWVPIWVEEADKWEQRAYFNANNLTDELRALRKALAYYSLAVYPWLMDDDRIAIYEKVKKLYKRVSELSGAPVEQLDIPFEGHILKAYLRRAKGLYNPTLPVIFFIRGLDSTKEVSYWDESMILDQGYAIISIDFPGMGENTCPMQTDSEKIFQAVINALADPKLYANKKIETDRIVTWGLGFGGYWAYKLAAIDSRIKAAINIGGPVHHAFSPSIFNYLKRFKEISFLKSVSKAALGPNFKGSVTQFAKQLSLIKNGVLTGITAPLLYVNGTSDLAVPSAEGNIVKHKKNDSKMDRQVLMFANEGHLAIDILDEVVLPHCLQWITQKVDLAKIKFSSCYYH